VYLNSSVGGTIEIGSYCLIGPKIIFRTASHNFRDKSVLIRYQGHKIGNLILEDDVWIGTGATLLGGITIGKSAVVGGWCSRDLS
jgi:acetyltransferase-like isoleucine patch superfamily enzyme